jgi:DNA-binding MarR family transcriptional regulator
MDDNMKNVFAMSTYDQETSDCCVQEISQLVQHLVRVMQMFERDQITPHHFTTSQAHVLIRLLESPGLTMNDLSDKLNAKTSTMTRIVNNLVRDGFIARERDASDRRIVVVSLTDKGRTAAQELKADIDAYYREIVSHLPEGQVEEVLRSVDLLVKAFDRANPNCC